MTPFSLEQTECPNCAASIDFHPSPAGGTLRCASCGTVFDRATFNSISTLAAAGFDADSRIEIGWTLNHAGTWRVAGRLRYAYDDGYWDEWVLVSVAGEVVYLEECEGDYRWLAPFLPKDAPLRAALDASSPGDELFIEGAIYQVDERIHARLAYFEGQLPWRAREGDEVSCLDVSRGHDALAIEYTQRELEFYRATAQDPWKLAAGFGVKAKPRDRSLYEETSEFVNPLNSQLKALVGLLFALFFMAGVGLLATETGCGSSSGTDSYSRPSGSGHSSPSRSSRPSRSSSGSGSWGGGRSSGSSSGGFGGGK